MNCDVCGEPLTEKPGCEVQCLELTCRAFIRIGMCCAAKDDAGLNANASHVHRDDPIAAPHLGGPLHPPVVALGAPIATYSTKGMAIASTGVSRLPS